MKTARCYMEFCCYPAAYDLHDYGDGASGPFNPAVPVYEWRGVRGWCAQHRPAAPEALEAAV